MSIRLKAVLKGVGVAVAVGLGVAACEQGSATGPAASGSVSSPAEVIPVAALGTAPYPGTKVGGKVTVCKDASSPAGTYSYTASASSSQSGDVISTNFTLTSGACAIVWERPAATAPNNATNITVTEVIPGGATYYLDHINAVDDAAGNRNVAGPSVVLAVKAEHGAVATFFNRASGHPAPPPPPPPPPTSQGHVVLCKSGQVAGTFTFSVNAVNTVGTDVVKSTTTLAAGSCDTVFVRVSAQPVAAAITITETVAANANTYLQGVTVDGQATATVGAGVVVTENFTNDRLVVFINAQATVGASVAYHPTSLTPGVVHLCKSASSPPGTFTFNVNAVGTVATDQIASTVSLTAGTCKVIFIRTVPQLVGATLTITENINVGTAVDFIGKTDVTGTAIITGSAGLVVTENGTADGGSLVIFFNKSILL